jgi:hypothetical protein
MEKALEQDQKKVELRFSCKTVRGQTVESSIVSI